MSKLEPINKKKIILLCIILIGLNLPFVIFSLTVKGPPLIYPEKEDIEVKDFSGMCHVGSNESNSDDYSMMKKLGFNWTRIDFHWTGIQPSSNEWFWGYWDGFLDATEENNVNVLALLLYDNDNIEEVETDSTKYIHPDDVPLFLEYVNRTIRRYRDRVAAWEIWNEPNILKFWGGPIEDFYYLFEETIELIHNLEKEFDEDLTILCSATTSSFALYVPSEVEEFFKRGLMTHIDIIPIHIYVYDADSVYQNIKQIHSLGEKYGFEGKYWITEIGNPTGGQYPHRVSQEKLADNVIKFHVISTVYNIERIFWYHDRDSVNPNENDSEGYFGLLYGDGKWKPGAFAYSLFNNHCINTVYSPNLIRKNGIISTSDLMVALYNKDDEKYTLILWYNPSLYESGSIKVEIDFSDKVKNAYIHDIYDGTNKPLIEDIIEVGNRPIFITFNSDEDISIIDLNITDPIILWGLFSLLFLVFIVSLVSTIFLHQKNKISHKM